MKILTLALFLFISLQADFLDDDMDGVENSLDRCPNTPFFALVDRYGCTTKKLSIKQIPRYSISTGYFYAKDTFSQKSYFVDFGFCYKNYSGYIESSRYSIENDSGQDDTTIALFYDFKDSLIYTIGIGAYLPTSSQTDNKTDYFFKIKLRYELDDFDTFASYKKTIMNDIDTYDTNSYTFGIGYNLTSNLYASLSYYQTSSIYNTNETIKYLTLYTNYYFTKNFFTSVSYSDGKNSQSIDKSYSISIGYDF